MGAGFAMEDAVPWTQPVDLRVRIETPFDDLVADGNGLVHCGMLDGSVRSLSKEEYQKNKNLSFFTSRKPKAITNGNAAVWRVHDRRLALTLEQELLEQERQRYQRGYASNPTQNQAASYSRNALPTNRSFAFGSPLPSSSTSIARDLDRRRRSGVGTYNSDRSLLSFFSTFFF